MPARDDFRMTDSRRAARSKTPFVQEITLVSKVDDSPDYSYLEDEHRYDGETPANRAKYIKQDKERLQDLFDGVWHYVGIWAEAQVVINNVVQKIQSGGLWGIESDSDKSYFKEVAKEQYDDLVDILKKMGVRRIPPFSDAEWKDR